MRSFKLIALLSFLFFTTNAQVLTREDSLNANLGTRDATTFISGYGELKAEYDFNDETSHANITRSVLFVGHRFNNKISFFSELELEDAKVEGGEAGGELALEQFYLKFILGKNTYLSAGLFTPRLGVINENHLPTTYLGNDRPFVEKLVIPATWREIGISIYGDISRINGLNYSFGIVNGLNSGGFENGTGIRGGRFEGRDATISNLALTGSLLYYLKDFRFQVSGYYGGTVGLNKKDSDSLNLENGPFGTPVSLVEANIQYNSRLLTFRALLAQVNIKDAKKINDAYGNNTPESLYGAYVEAGINLLYFFDKDTKKALNLFARYENMDLNKKIPENGTENGMNKKDILTTGLTFQPIHGIVIKADYVYTKTGDPAANQTPQPTSTGTTNSFLNLGFGYSF